MTKKDRVQNIILIIMVICVITLTVAYAILIQNLDINGVASVKKIRVEYTFYKCFIATSIWSCNWR